VAATDALARVTAVCGPKKAGKSLLIALLGRVFAWEDEGAVSTGAVQLYGQAPQGVEKTPRLSIMREKLAKWGPAGHLRTFQAGAACDDMSVALDEDMLQWGAEPSENRYHRFNRLDEELTRFRKAARDAMHGAPFTMTFHDVLPARDKKTGQLTHKGGPKVPSANQTETVPAVCDAVFHVRPWSESPYPDWKYGLYGMPGDTAWSTADRWQVATVHRPMLPPNLREYYRQTGWDCGRPPGLEWMDQEVDRIVRGALDSGDLAGTVRAASGYYLSNGAPKGIVWWLCHDAIARHWYFTHPTSLLDGLLAGFDGTLSVPGAPGGPPPPPPLGAPPPGAGSPAQPPGPAAAQVLPRPPGT